MTPSSPSLSLTGTPVAWWQAWDLDKQSSTIGTWHAKGHPANWKPPSVFDTTATLFDTCERIPILTPRRAWKVLNLCQSVSISPKRPICRGIADLTD